MPEIYSRGKVYLNGFLSFVPFLMLFRFVFFVHEHKDNPAFGLPRPSFGLGRGIKDGPLL